MVRAALRDLQWRRRRFVIAVAGTALVFAVSLVLAGVSASFGQETDRTLAVVGADVGLVRDGVPGPFTSFVPFREEWADQIKGEGIERADPILVVDEGAPVGRLYLEASSAVSQESGALEAGYLLNLTFRAPHHRALACRHDDNTSAHHRVGATLHDPSGMRAPPEHARVDVPARREHKSVQSAG